MRPSYAFAASAAAYATITAFLGRDVLAHPGTVVTSDAGDPLLVAALLVWNATRVPLSDAWWQFPIFYPTRDALAISEHFLGVSAISTPLYWMTGDALVTYNLVTLLTFPLCGAAMYALVYHLTRSSAGAFLAGLAYAFAPYRIAQLPHLQMLVSFWAPLALLGLHAYLDGGKRRWLALYGAAWLLQGAANGYALVFLSVLVGLWVIWFVVARARWRELTMIAGTTLLALLPLVPILRRYIAVHTLHGFSRDLAEMRTFSADLAAIFCAPEGLTFWHWFRTACRPEGQLFPGVAVATIYVVALSRIVARSGPDATPASWSVTLLSRALFAAGLLYAAVVGSVLIGGPWRVEVGPLVLSSSSIEKPIMVSTAMLLFGLVLSPGVRTAARGSSTAGFYVLAALAAWVLALGPTVTLMGEPRGIPAPFALLTYLPGASGLRVPARFWLIAQMCLGVVTGLFAATLLEGRRRAVRIAFVTLIGGALLADGWIDRMPVVPAVASTPDPRPPRNAVVLELPLGLFADIAAQFRGVVGGWRTVNGYSGYLPHYYPALMDAVAIEEGSALTPFRALGDLHVIVSREAPRLMALVERQPGAAVAARGPHTVRYFLPGRAAGPVPSATGERLEVQSVSASCNPSSARNAVDHDPRTRWECGPQRPGHELVIDLGRGLAVGSVVQDLGTRTSDFPGHLVVETSLDGVSWDAAWQDSVRGLLIREAIERPGPALRITVPLGRRQARYIRLRQTGTDRELSWSITELEVWSGP
jgi:hypothetical protein